MIYGQQQQQQQPVANTAPSPLQSLSQGFFGRMAKKKGGNMLHDVFKSFMAKPGGNGITGSVSPDLPGILNDSQAASMTLDPAMKAPSMDIAGNLAAGGGGFAGNAAISASGTPVGFEGGDLGGGISTSAGEPGLALKSGEGVGYSPASDGGTGTATVNGAPAESGGSWGSAAAGALSGYGAGVRNYYNDPNMRSGEDGFGKHHPDYRASIGGGTVGGLLGYYGDSLGAAAAGPVVQAIHPMMEKFTRNLINTGDKVGDSAGAMTLDPIGTLASGKYSEDQIAKDHVKYSLLGGLANYIK